MSRAARHASVILAVTRRNDTPFDAASRDGRGRRGRVRSLRPDMSATGTAFSGKRVPLDLAEEAVRLLDERPLVLYERGRHVARPLEQRAVGAQAREAEVADAGLARAEE